jgi:hypothetical protein
VLDVKKAALHATVSEALIRLWVKEGTLPHYRFGGKGKRGKILIEVEDLDHVMATFKVGSSKLRPDHGTGKQVT